MIGVCSVAPPQNPISKCRARVGSFAQVFSDPGIKRLILRPSVGYVAYLPIRICYLQRFRRPIAKGVGGVELVYSEGTPQIFKTPPTCGGLQNWNPHIWWLSSSSVGCVVYYYYIYILLLLLLLLYSLYERKTIHPTPSGEKPPLVGGSMHATPHLWWFERFLPLHKPYTRPYTVAKRRVF